MHTVNRVSTRLLLLALTAMAALAVSVLAADVARATTVHLRVETPTETLFNGSVNTGPRTVAAEDVPGSNANFCDSDGAADANATSPSPNTAVADSGLSYGTSGLRYSFGTAMCRIGAYGTTATESWTVKINNKMDGYSVSGDTTVVDGDKVLWYFGPWSISSSLDLVLPAKVGVGQQVTGRVDAYDNGTDLQSPAAGAQVTGGGASATAGADGLFSISFATPGRYLVSATKADAVRASAWVEVEPAAVELPPIGAQPGVSANRFRACAARYGKDSPLHRRCVRIVRAKQLRECRKQAAPKSKLCLKVLARAKRRAS